MRTNTPFSLIIKNLIHPKTLWKMEFFRFLVAGALNTIFGYLVFVILIFCGINYALALIIATLIGSIFNYYSYGIIAFRKTEKKMILRFLVLYTVLYFFNLGLFKLFLNITANKILVQAMCVPILVLTAYIVNKKMVFSEKPE